MKKILLPFILLMLAGCSATGLPEMTYMDKNSRGISILNVKKEEHVKAYREAEKHCAKYFKVPRIIQSSVQLEKTDVPMSTIIFECLKAN